MWRAWPAAAGEVDAPERHPQSRLAGLKQELRSCGAADVCAAGDSESVRSELVGVALSTSWSQTLLTPSN